MLTGKIEDSLTSKFKTKFLEKSRTIFGQNGLPGLPQVFQDGGNPDYRNVDRRRITQEITNY